MTTTFTSMVPGWIEAFKAGIGSSDQPRVASSLATEQDLEALRTHQQVKERVQDGMQHLSSFNYIRGVKHQDMDAVSLLARGLFINTDTLEVVIRGYDKTPLINEPGLERASFPEVLKNTSAPYTTSVMENGFLGLVSYDRKTDEIIFATKSVINPSFHDWADRHIRKNMTLARYENLKTLLRDCRLTLAFEVVEPVLDPHIIESSRSKLVLLDGIRNSLVFEKITRSQLEALGDIFDFECRAAGPSFSSKKALVEFVIGAMKNGYKHHSLDGLIEIEGLMIEDANGNMVKLKLPFYQLWKACRASMEALSSKKPKPRGRIPQEHLSDQSVTAFLEWYKVQDPAPARRNIIKGRNAFLAANPEMSSPSFEGFAMTPEAEAEALSVAG